MVFYYRSAFAALLALEVVLGRRAISYVERFSSFSFRSYVELSGTGGCPGLWRLYLQTLYRVGSGSFNFE